MSDLCEHGYVVRAVEGINRYWCKECDGRFPDYPEQISRETARRAYQEKLTQEEIAGYQEWANAMVRQVYGKS